MNDTDEAVLAIGDVKVAGLCIYREPLRSVQRGERGRSAIATEPAETGARNRYECAIKTYLSDSSARGEEQAPCCIEG